MGIKDNVRAFKLANRTFILVRKFNNDFLSALSDCTLEEKMKMYQLCLKYMHDSMNEKFEVKSRRK